MTKQEIDSFESKLLGLGYKKWITSKYGEGVVAKKIYGWLKEN